MKKTLIATALLSLSLAEGKDLDSFLGIRFGSSPEAVQKFLNRKTVAAKTKDSRIVHVYLGNHRLKGACGTMYVFTQKGLAHMTVRFCGKKAEGVYDILLGKVNRHYGEMTPELKFGGKKATLIHPPLYIQLTYSAEPFGTTNTEIDVSNIQLVSEWGMKQKKKKSDALGDL